jgi:Xaa-Pro aminopeptidase
MADHGLDALMLGGVGDVKYVSGARQLGRSGVLPFAPVAVVVRETQRIHLLSTWDEGVPPEIGHDDLYRMSWNPANLAADLARIPGLRDARRVGTDGMTPMFASLIADLVTKADIVDAGPVMTQARRIKTTDEILCLEVASAISEAALSAMADALAEGATERELLAIYHERIASLGAPMPPSEAVCFEAAPNSVTLAPGALYAGYEAGLARTRVADEALISACEQALDALTAACRPGNTGADLYNAWESTGFDSPALRLAHGLGLGAEPPLIGLGRGRDVVLDAGMVLCVQSSVRGCLQRDTVLIDNAGPTVLTRYGRL